MNCRKKVVLNPQAWREGEGMGEVHCKASQAVAEYAKSIQIEAR